MGGGGGVANVFELGKLFSKRSSSILCRRDSVFHHLISSENKESILSCASKVEKL